MLLIPTAAAPRISLWRAILFLSLQTICMTGSKPSPLRIKHEAALDILTTLVWLSVMLIESTYPFRRFAFFFTTSASAPLGGPHSLVTAKPPLLRTFSRLLALISSDPPEPVF